MLARTPGMEDVETRCDVSRVFAGETVRIKQTEERIWLVSFMDDDLGYVDDDRQARTPCKSVRTKV